MLRFVARRLLLLVPILLGLSILLFLWIRALPGGPAESLLGERATPEAIEQIERIYGLDQPIYVQYLRYLENLVSGDLGTSIASRRPVTEEIGRRFPATIELAIAAMIFAIAFGVPLGFFAAKRYGSAVDHGSLVASLIGISIPVFFLAILLKYVFAVELGWLPTIGRQDVLIDADHPTGFYVLDGIITLNFEAAWDAAAHLILPAIALGSIPLAILARITRASVLDVQNEDYVRTARAKGVSSHTVDRRHIFRNAMLPVVTIIGLQTACSSRARSSPRRCSPFPGMGTWLAGAIESRDYPGAPGRNPLRGDRLRDREPARRRVVRPPRPSHPGELDVSVAQLESAEIQLEAPSGLWSDAWRRLIRNPGALVGFGLVALFVFTAIFAPLIAPYDPREHGPEPPEPTAAVRDPRQSTGSASTSSGETSSRASSTEPVSRF